MGSSMAVNCIAWTCNFAVNHTKLYYCNGWKCFGGYWLGLKGVPHCTVTCLHRAIKPNMEIYGLTRHLISACYTSPYCRQSLLFCCFHMPAI